MVEQKMVEEVNPGDRAWTAYHTCYALHQAADGTEFERWFYILMICAGECAVMISENLDGSKHAFKMAMRCERLAINYYQRNSTALPMVQLHQVGQSQ